jgi:hypothetical protein
MRINHHRRDACTAQHRGGGRAGQSAANDRNIRIAHGLALVPEGLLLRRKGKENLESVKRSKGGRLDTI